MRKPSVAALTCVAVASMLALGAGSASAAQSGRKVVKGHTAQGRSIRVAIHKNSIEIKHFTIKLSCKGTGPLIDVESGFLPSQLRRNNRIPRPPGRLDRQRLHPRPPLPPPPEGLDPRPRPLGQAQLRLALGAVQRPPLSRPS